MNTLVDHSTAEALFASDLQPSQHPDLAELAQTAAAVLARHGCGGCAALVAAEFGDHPDQAAARMRWALDAESQLCDHDEPAWQSSGPIGGVKHDAHVTAHRAELLRREHEQAAKVCAAAGHPGTRYHRPVNGRTWCTGCQGYVTTEVTR